MIATTEGNIRVLIPEDGKWLTNGKTYSQKVYLGKNASADDWYEVDTKPEPEEPTEPMTETEEKAMAYDILMGVTE